MIKKDSSAYKTISEVAELLNLFNIKTGKLSTHTLRYWEKEFKEIKPLILAGNRRYYDAGMIEKLQKIKFLLKDKGMTIQGVKKYLISDETKLDEIDKMSISKKNNLKSKLTSISNKLRNLKDN